MQKFQFLRRTDDEPEHLGIGVVEHLAQLVRAGQHAVTAQGRLHVLGGRDPETQWARPWDGQWRLVLFDVPTGQNSQRERLRRYLRDKGFGYVQNSV